MEERREILGEVKQLPFTYHESGTIVLSDMISFVVLIVYSTMNSYHDERGS